MRLTLLFVLVGFTSLAQEVDVQYDKTRDLSRYKTFMIGGGEVITPKDQQQVNEVALKKMVRDAIAEELKEKKLAQVDSLADLTASFVIGSKAQSDFEQLGPAGMTPGSDSRSWSRDYRLGSLIVDLNDRSNNLIWRINGTTTASSTDVGHLIDEVIAVGFKKFSLKPKKVKKK